MKGMRLLWWKQISGTESLDLIEHLIQHPCFGRDGEKYSSPPGFLQVWEAGTSEQACQVCVVQSRKGVVAFQSHPQATVRYGDMKMTQPSHTPKPGADEDNVQKTQEGWGWGGVQHRGNLRWASGDHYDALTKPKDAKA